METTLAICAGLGLSAACGFRVFVPLLALGIATRAGTFAPSAELAWVGTWPAIAMFGVATAVEVAAYHVPFVDHLLDAIATPAAVVAGTVATAAVLGDVDPALKWSAALIAGGGAAGLFQGASVATRAVSAATTGGLGNPVVALVEAVVAVVLAILAVVLPVVAAVAVGALAFFAIRAIARAVRRRRAAPPADVPLRPA